MNAMDDDSDYYSLMGRYRSRSLSTMLATKECDDNEDVYDRDDLERDLPHTNLVRDIEKKATTNRQRIQNWMRAIEKSQYYVVFLLIALVLARSTDQVLYVRIAYTYSYYVLFFSSVILPIAFISITIPIVVYKWMYTNDITKEMRKFPQWKFACLGLLDSLFNIFSTFPIQHLGGSMTNILSQTVLPSNMLLSALILKTKYRKNHYLGAVLVIYGVMVKLIPSMTGQDDSGEMGGSFGWMLLLVGANFLAALSNVFKETALKGHDLDEWYMNLWVSFYQLIFGVLCFWQGYLDTFMTPSPAIGTCTDCTWGTYMRGASTCFIGGTVEMPGFSTKDDCDHGDFNEIDGTCRLDCSGSRGGGSMSPVEIFMIFIVFNITYNYLMLRIFKVGSSVLFVVANAVRLPVVSIFLTFKFLAASATQSFTCYDGFALVMLLIGTYVYNSQKEVESEDESLDTVDDCTTPQGATGRGSVASTPAV